MPAYITELSDNDFEVLEEIFIEKYNKFIHLYWLLKEYSENISLLLDIQARIFCFASKFNLF